MSDIGHINSSLGSRDLEPRPIKRAPTEGGKQPGRDASAPRREPDRVELSPAAKARAADGDIRAEVVVRVREAIVRGGYDTPERLNAAVDAMIEDVARQGQ
jgi:hypothetical protein